jgi:peptide/nickel transport system ATP-binding protein
MALMLITHDLGVIAEMADDVVVMYAGQIVERGSVRTIFAEPHHPYTRALLASTPRLRERRPRLDAIEGMVPNLVGDMPDGCLFRDRCRFAMDICQTTPPLREFGRHQSRCWLPVPGDPPEHAVSTARN